MKTFIFSTAALALVGTLLVGVQTVFSDDDGRYEGRGYWERDMMRSTGVTSKPNPLYQEECGSCHMAYPPGLLPSASWRKMMGNLEDHFGDNAQLDDDVSQQLTEFLVANSASNSNDRRSRAFEYGSDYPDTMIPLRITDLPYFRHEHNEIPRWVLKRAGIGSLSECSACHQNAEKGWFNEHDIYIKGIGRWDD
ncbi:diheme cytochrome c [Solemya velum gill symbiont]|uniref:Dihem cytochrome c n=1 Tax=Solemya velum gill symbiont TaxID=2340 RepID=A0A0B0H8J9_SOVGS|nr:diheme cytochrome c [Solemya velum gill symbiont]KHF24977.1 dihem cytochrome c [Solemya velum gill symbiont]OOY34635.1 hypothetical protein BOV88_09290 [Solemya velum gill symbiont]OOY37429.1 hypothetical protein BOV89_07725 [Solemya velum gill symbiont]OOY40392.1 hypothetical protein BOV90_04280 [Solemya velum gill symbiont]OOY44791.1 hypothetical protein BOV91_00290 [Solemya velum gill symbiont]